MLGDPSSSQVLLGFIRMSPSLVCKVLEEGACGRISFVPGTASDTSRAWGPMGVGGWHRQNSQRLSSEEAAVGQYCVWIQAAGGEGVGGGVWMDSPGCEFCCAFSAAELIVRGATIVKAATEKESLFLWFFSFLASVLFT